MMTEVSEAQQAQRESAAVKHGAYAFRDRGEQALQPEGRSRLAELRDMMQDRDSIIEVLQSKAADSVLLFEIVQAHVAKGIQSGKSLTEIPGFKALPAFFNSMHRALTSLLSMMPDDEPWTNDEMTKLHEVIDASTEGS